jgi:hypothetical protein
VSGKSRGGLRVALLVFDLTQLLAIREKMRRENLMEGPGRCFDRPLKGRPLRLHCRLGIAEATSLKLNLPDVIRGS